MPSDTDLSRPAPGLGRPGPGQTARRSGFLHPTTLFAVALAACLGFGLWAACNRPASAPDFTGRIAGLAFSPFQRGQSPEAGDQPTDAQLRADLVLAAGVTGQIRTYGVDGTLGDIPALAHGLPLRITLGAWLTRDPAANAAQLQRLIALAQANRNVTGVLVGNETLLRKDLTAAQLVAAIQAVKRAVNVPVSTAEPWHVWLAHPELAAAVDVITIHLLPYWEGLPADAALKFLLAKLDQVQAAYPDKRIVIGEVGWPSDGVTVGAARASRVLQAQVMRGFLKAAQARGLDYFVMEAFDQPWKTSFEGRAAGYWGLYDLDRHAKWPMTGKVWETPSWPLWAGFSAALAALLAWPLLSRRPDIRLPGKLLLAGLAQGFAGALVVVLLTISQTYLSGATALVWGVLAAAQALLLALLMADSFELAETLWGGAPRRRFQPAPAAYGAALPKVSVHIPICNEPPHLVRQTLDALARLDYPDFEVVVVDNNTADPALWEPVAEHCARLGARFRFLHLGPWPGYKAGALNVALRHACPDAAVIAVLDADYVVRPDWLRCMAPCFDDPRVGFVQSPQDYRDNDGSLFKRLMFWEYAGFFQLGMVTRNARNAIIQHGTMTLVRAAALRDAGGWAEWTITEDAELGLRLFRRGWQALYAPESFGRGVMPDDFCAFRRQRARWAFGAMQICRTHWRALLSPFNRDLSLGQRWHFVTGWLPWIGDALGLAFMLIGLVWSVVLMAAPLRAPCPLTLFMLPALGLFGFRLVHILALYRFAVPCSGRDRLGAAVAGLALSHTIAKAVGKGLLVRSSPFRRTPKLMRAPAFVRGLAMAGEELALLLASWAAVAGVAAARGLDSVEARLWCIVLLTQSLPYLASVATALLATVPARRVRLTVAADLAVRSGAGD
jgi:exo-beta-1,3-glucanase (GH17 family)/cellulose synthase/poly-beta-1,6-N-acetylglucosamine synthase-like glycosyltransferase